MIDQALKTLTLLLQGKLPGKIEKAKVENQNERELAKLLNQLVLFMEEIHRFVIPLAQGELSDIKFSPNNFLASPFKELHSRLRHLTWQAKQVANGDFCQRIDFMGEFSEAFNLMVTALQRNERVLREKIDQLEQALGHIKRLEGILPICSQCKRIRIEKADPDDQKNWLIIERYLSTKTDAQFTHSICPECKQKLYPEYIDPKPDED